MINHRVPFYKSIGFYILSLYIFLTYIPQIIFHIIFHSYFLIHYNAANYNPFIILIVLVLFYFFVFLVENIIPYIKINKINFSNDLKIILSFVSFMLSLLFLYASFKFWNEYTISFRATHRLRETSFIIKLLFFLREFAWMYVFIQLVKILRGYKLTILNKINLIIILVGWILSLTASLSIPLILVILLILFFEKKLYLILTTKNISGFKFLIIGIISLVFVLFAIFFGYANKFGIEKAYLMFTDKDLISYLLARTLARLSTSFESVISLFYDHFQDFHIQLISINGFIDTFLSRLSSITHLFDYHINDIETINRINFFVLFTPLHWHLAFAGASPGLLATIFYIPIFPFNFIFMAFYVIIIIRVMNRYLPFKSSDFNIFGKLILLYMTFRLYEAPLDIFYIIEPKFFYVLLFVIGSIFFDRRYKYVKI